MGPFERVGRNARDPHTVATLVAISALAFTAVWVWWAGRGPLSAAYLPLPFFLLVVPPNAYLVTRVVWARYVAPAPSLSRRRALQTGVSIALLSYVTLSAALGLYLGLYELFVGIPPALLRPTGPLTWFLAVSVTGPVFGLFLTGFLPVLLTVSIALWLARLDARYGDGAHRRPGEAQSGQ